MPKELSPEYRAFILSQEWAHIRQDAMNVHGHRCSACQRASNVQFHHLHYPTPLTATKPAHLMPLCLGCHEAVHRQTRFYPTTRTEAHCHGKRMEILQYLRTIVTRVDPRANHDQRKIDARNARRALNNPRKKLFAAFRTIRAAMLAYIETTHHRTNPSIRRLADPTLFPDASFRLFGQIIGHEAGRQWQATHVPRLIEIGLRTHPRYGGRAC